SGGGRSSGTRVPSKARSARRKMARHSRQHDSRRCPGTGTTAEQCARTGVTWHTSRVTTAPRKQARGRPPPTPEEVAARAGVSRATASRVLRGDTKVSEHARTVVMDAAREISYVPNLAARSLVTGRSDSVAFLVEESEERMFADPFFLRML